MDDINDAAQKELLKYDLTRQYGALVGGDDLRRLLGYRSLSALRAAIKRGTLGLRTFPVNGRKGSFALTADIADWLIILKKGKMPRSSEACDN